MLVMRAAIAHVVGDILQSIGVAVAGALIWAFSDRWLDADGLSYWYRIDPICTFAFSVLVMWSSVGTTRDAIHVLMAGSPSNVDLSQVEKQLRAIPTVVDVHCMHSWTIAGDHHNMMAHIQISPGSNSTPVLYAAQRIASAAGCHHTCFQVEDAGGPSPRQPSPALASLALHSCPCSLTRGALGGPRQAPMTRARRSASTATVDCQ